MRLQATPSAVTSACCRRTKQKHEENRQLPAADHKKIKVMQRYTPSTENSLMSKDFYFAGMEAPTPLFA